MCRIRRQRNLLLSLLRVVDLAGKGGDFRLDLLVVHPVTVDVSSRGNSMQIHGDVVASKARQWKLVLRWTWKERRSRCLQRSGTEADD